MTLLHKQDMQGRLREIVLNWVAYKIPLETTEIHQISNEQWQQLYDDLETYTEDKLREFATWLSEGEFDPQTGKDNVDYFLEEAQQLKSKKESV